MPHKFNTSSNPSNLWAMATQMADLDQFWLPAYQSSLSPHIDMATRYTLPTARHLPQMPQAGLGGRPLACRRSKVASFDPLKSQVGFGGTSAKHGTQSKSTLGTMFIHFQLSTCHSVHISELNCAAACIKHACQSLRP